jgi:hypothetical protein
MSKGVLCEAFSRRMLWLFIVSAAIKTGTKLPEDSELAAAITPFVYDR